VCPRAACPQGATGVFEYHSPHKFRHGHAVFALKNAKNISALKAVSQNLMHANLSVTDGVYGILSEMDVKEQINNLGLKTGRGEKKELSDLVTLTKQLEELIKDYKLS
jgi:hypothetical protein